MIGTTTATPPPTPQPKQRDYVSFSAISSYQRCPLAYYYRYVAGLPEKTVAASLVFGAAVHRAADVHYQALLAGDEPPTVDALRGEYDRHWQEIDPQTVQFGKDDDLESLGQLAERMFVAFKASPLATPAGQIIGIEEEIRGAVVAGCPDVVGRIDLLVETADELVLTDLKTSRSRWTAEQAESSSEQLLLYHELVRGFAPRKRLKLRFGVLTKSAKPLVELHEVPTNQVRVDRTKRVVEKVWRAIEGGHFYPAPSPMQCPTCPFRAACREWR